MSYEIPPLQEEPNYPEAYTLPVDAYTGCDPEEVSLGSDDETADTLEPEQSLDTSCIGTAPDWGEESANNPADQEVTTSATEQTEQQDAPTDTQEDSVPESTERGVSPPEPPTHDSAAGAPDEEPEGAGEDLRAAAALDEQKPLDTELSADNADLSPRVDDVSENPQEIALPVEAIDGQTAERSPEPLATPGQAADLLKEVATFTTLQGTRFSDRHSASAGITEVPAEVAQHFPAPEVAADKVTYSADVMQQFDPATGQPLRAGVVGMASFSQYEEPDDRAAGVTVTAANYHIITENDGETYRLERHTTHVGPRVSSRPPEWRHPDMIAYIEEKESLLKNLEASLPMERTLGLLDVTQTEARQVIDAIKALNERG